MIPASKHSSKIFSRIDLFPSGQSSFGKALVKGSILVPKPASGIIACLTITKSLNENYKKSKEINLLFKNIKKSGFVPTMGSLHKGHEYLIKKSITENKITVVSIFLNSKQFNNKNDLKKYPKKINDDIRICKKLKVNYLFIPSFNEIYSWKSKKEKYPKINKIMEHKYRKGHFKGVLQVIEKLTDIVPSSKNVFRREGFSTIKNYKRLYI